MREFKANVPFFFQEPLVLIHSKFLRGDIWQFQMSTVQFYGDTFGSFQMSTVQCLMSRLPLS